MTTASNPRTPLTFLEARKVLAQFTGGTKVPLLLGMSGNVLQLETYVRAAAARRGLAVELRTLPFNTLAQTLATPPREGEREVCLLLPWDFAAEFDWRSGIPADAIDEAAMSAGAEDVRSRIAARAATRCLYVAAPMPALFHDTRRQAAFEHALQSAAASLGARIVEPSVFSLASYFANGCPVASASQGHVAELIVDAMLEDVEPRKVLVTDLDNVVWGGGIAEEGIDGIEFAPHGAGFRHFVYQGFLEKLRREGVLLAAVSRNDADVAIAPFRTGRLVLREESFVAFLASYHAKSAQIRELANRLNLGLNAFVFVDDNEIELAEVSAALPEVACVQFPTSDERLPDLLAQLQKRFARPTITAEDRERTELYRRRTEGMAPTELGGADLTEFLRQLDMTLTIHDRSTGDRTRAVQLINKTNQFNLNGRRIEAAEVDAMLAAGGRLFGASLADRTGAHGEILSCLINPDGTVESLVLSCRVFQRRVEHAFLAWLCAQPSPPHRLAFASTERNEPLRQFLEDAAFGKADSGFVAFDSAGFVQRHGAAVELFKLVRP